MIALNVRYAAIAITLAVMPVGAQTVSTPSGVQGGSAAPVSASRVLAGVRDYPESAIEALVALARQPEWLDKAVARVRAGQELAIDDASAPESIRAAFRVLAGIPEVILVADANREELGVLRDIRTEAPQGGFVRVQQLRTDYATARREAALRWQLAIQGNAEAQAQYRELVSGYCRKMRERIPNFACVEVTNPQYYLAAPPDDMLMGYAQHEKAAPDGLWSLMTDWWDRYGADRTDAHILSGAGAVPASRAENALIDAAADQRRAMWHTADGAPAPTASLMPVILQPLADQPDDARLAYAIAEHERLWSSQDGDAPPLGRAPSVAMADDAALIAAAEAGSAEFQLDAPIDEPVADGEAGVIVTAARPDMIIPPGGRHDRFDDRPEVVVAGVDDGIAYVDDDDDFVVEDPPPLGQTVFRDSGPVVVYDDRPDVYFTRPSSFGFSFGYSSFGTCFPSPLFIPSCPPRPCGRTYAYYPRFYSDCRYVAPVHVGGNVLIGQRRDGSTSISIGGRRLSDRYRGHWGADPSYLLRRDGAVSPVVRRSTIVRDSGAAVRSISRPSDRRPADALRSSLSRDGSGSSAITREPRRLGVSSGSGVVRSSPLGSPRSDTARSVRPSYQRESVRGFFRSMNGGSSGSSARSSTRSIDRAQTTGNGARTILRGNSSGSSRSIRRNDNGKRP